MDALCLKFRSRHGFKLVLAVRVDAVGMLSDKAFCQAALVGDVAFVYITPCPLSYLIHFRRLGGVRANGFHSDSNLVAGKTKEWGEGGSVDCCLEYIMVAAVAQT